MIKGKFVSLVIVVILLLVNTLPIYAAYYYVSTTGSDGNSGGSGSSWATIQHAADTMQAGDVCYVSAGTYDERVATTKSGSAGNLITFKAVGTVKMRGFNFSTDYIRVIGFEITGTTNQDDAIVLSNKGCEVWDNYIHDIGIGVRGKNGFIFNNSASYSLVKGNRIVDMSPGLAGQGVLLSGSNNVFEYNEITGVGDDLFRNSGSRNITRNNYLHDSASELGEHMDCLQTISWTVFTDLLFESNYIIRLTGSGSHGLVLEGGAGCTSKELIYRNNVMTRLSSYAALLEEPCYVRFINNTVCNRRKL